jgi:hypothetical protein
MDNLAMGRRDPARQREELQNLGIAYNKGYYTRTERLVIKPFI